MPHKAEGRCEPKPWAAGLLKLSLLLFVTMPFYFFMGGFFTPYMATGAARGIDVCMSDVLLVLLVLTVVALGSLGYSVEKVDVNRFVLRRGNKTV
jgi:hypothetical protein